MYLITVFCIVVLIQSFFYLFLFGKFSFSKPSKKRTKSISVSVVICARNESSHLQENLLFVANQDFPKFEIVLVNDASTDDTLEVMLQFKKNYTSEKLSIQVVNLFKKDLKGKKIALSQGIKASKYPYILVTDADCKPISRSWIKEISVHFSTKKSIVLGYGAYQKIESSFLNKIIRFETLLTAIQYFSYARIGKAYMGVGRNMAYTKEEFINAQGFNKHLNIVSGDDDLFINQISNSENTEICFSKNSFTESKPKTQFKSWIDQKRRHITTASHYTIIHKLSLGLFFTSQILFWLLALVLLILNSYIFFTIFLIILRFTFWYLVISKSASNLNEKDLIRLAPLYEISIIFIQLYIFLRNIISSPKYW